MEVRYVDFGDKRIVSVCELRKIKNEFFTLPARVRASNLAKNIPGDVCVYF